ncbi:hypothetical protein E2562_007179 [Oryza meyeriana var. granulata]|uniref:Uncharacterized protein n=1 Tax=Oryza meyeriana var. granulata TaxID=110450 RepID=A0A6G1CCW8_9ORYZ|nr:hypothetical protein E2562_007179 [Oryza meyeriana var. granulata]
MAGWAVSGLRRERGVGVDGKGEAYDDEDAEHKRGKDRGAEGGREDRGVEDDEVDAHLLTPKITDQR